MAIVIDACSRAASIMTTLARWRGVRRVQPSLDAKFGREVWTLSLDAKGDALVRLGKARVEARLAQHAVWGVFACRMA